MSTTLRLVGVSLLIASLLAGCQADPTVATVAVSHSSTSTSSATVSWQAPITNTDGSPLTDLAGYNIHYGTSADDMNQTIALTGVGIQTYVIDGLTSGTWYFAVQAVASDGDKSALSEIVSKTIG
jgi:hypothetical protein